MLIVNHIMFVQLYHNICYGGLFSANSSDLIFCYNAFCLRPKNINFVEIFTNHDNRLDSEMHNDHTSTTYSAHTTVIIDNIL